MKLAALLTCNLALSVSAYPFVLNEVNPQPRKRQTLPPAGSDLAKQLSKARGNCGVIPCPGFDAATQYVSTSGEHAFQAPKSTDIRGLCPGLNAAANHGYLNRDGVQGILNTITGLGAAYATGPDLAALLATYAVIFNGDPITQTWSIGGPPPANILSPITGTLLGSPQGIGFSHNNYEGDVSISRPDAYLNNGDASSLDIDRFQNAYDYQVTPDRYNLDTWAQNFWFKLNQSVAENPYFFSAPFAGLVAPAAYNFVINMMSNRSAEEPQGYLDGSIFKTFFSITGESGSFKWNPGQERIPENWYKRSPLNPYRNDGVVEDLVAQFLAYPDSFRQGGNTGTVNSFEGFNFGDLTGGVFPNAAFLLEGNNLQCFFTQFALAVVPDVANGPFQDAISSLSTKYIASIPAALGCPEMTSVDTTQFSKYPGASYRPTAPKSLMH